MANNWFSSQRLLVVVAIVCVSAAFSVAQQGTRQVTDASQTQRTGASLGTYEALVIGNNDYKNVVKLQTAVNDADAIATVLHDRYGFHATVLHNATRSQIITALVNYRRTLPESSNLLIYYAGHGNLDKEVDEAYWLPVDADKDNNENWISADDITRDIKAIHSFHVLIISDSCYSGTLTRDANVGITLIDKQKVLARMLQSKSRTLLASGGNEPVADSGGGAGHSVFAGALLQVLRNMEDSQFTADSLFEALRPRVAGRSSQVPKYDYLRDSGHEDGDFVFSRLGAKPLVVPIPSNTVVENGENVPDIPPDRSNVTQPLSFDPDREAAAIKDLLKTYEDAYESRDAQKLKTIWPTIAPKTFDLVEKSFATAAAIQMNLHVGSPNIGQDHNSATVKGSFSQTYTPKNGSAQPRSGDIAFSLQKKNGLWAIVDIK